MARTTLQITSGVKIQVKVKNIKPNAAFASHVKDRFNERLAEIGDAVVARIQHNIAKSNEGGRNPSRPGEFPRRGTGNLSRSIGWRWTEGGLGGQASIEVGSNLAYAAHLEKGTSGGKMVRPKVARFLSWVNEQGQRRFARFVVTRGMAPRPFMARSLKQAETKIRSIWTRRGLRL